MSFSFSMDDMPRLLVMLLLAAILGYIAHLMAGGRVPLGFVGTILFGLLGAWVTVDILRPRIPLDLPTEPTYNDVMLVSAGIGAFVFSLLWSLFMARLTRSRR